MIGAAIQALLSHWRRHPLQLVTLITGLALATGLWSAVQAINGEARANYASAARQLGTGQGDTLQAVDGMIPLARYVALRRAGWQVSPVLEGRTRLGGRSVTILGIEALTSPPLPALSQSSGQSGADLRDMLGVPGRLFVRPDLATRITDIPGLPPVVATDQVPPGVILTDIGVAEDLLGLKGQISRLVILPVQPIGLPPLSEIAPELIRHKARGQSDTARLTDSFHLNLTAFGFLSFAVGLFIVHGTTGLVFEQRRAMFRTLRALGLPLRVLTLLVLAEILALAMVAGGLGLVIGYLVAAALLPDVAASLRGLYGAPVTGGLTFRLGWVASGLGMSLAGALLASARSLWHLRALPILASGGARAWAVRAEQSDLRLGGAGVALIAAGALAALLFDGLIAGFALLGGLMLGSALLLPVMLAGLLRIVQARARSPLTEWVWADMRIQLPGVSLALMALLLALATNIGVNTMVASFRLTFTGWLDQRLASELYVTARDDAQGRAIEAWLAPRTDAVLPIRSTETSIAGYPVYVYGIIDHQTYREHWPLLEAVPQVWDQLAAGNAILINEQLARRLALWPGDVVTLAPGWQLPVAGVYSDYGNPTGQAIVSMANLLSHAHNVANQRFGIRIATERAASLASELREDFDLPANGVVDQAGIKAQSLAIFDKTFVVTGALNLLTLGVAGFAILTSLLTLWTLRLPQLAPVWALGVTRAQLARLEMLRSLALAAMTACLALPLGLGLAWALLEVINVKAFGWRLPMHVFPLDWVWLFALALLAAAVAAAIPVLRLRRVPPSDLLKVFANER